MNLETTTKAVDTARTALEDAKNLILSLNNEKMDLLNQIKKLLSIAPDGDVKKQVQKTMEWYKE